MTNILTCFCQAFVSQRSYSSSVQLVKVHEGAETAQFKALFAVWERERPPGQVKPTTNRIGTRLQLPAS